MDNRQLIEIPQPLGLYAEDLRRRGDEYFEAFRLLSDHAGDGLPFARYFLLVHSIEVFLKAYLAACGTSKKDLQKTFSHRLDAIIDACIAHGMPPVDNVRAFVRTFHEMNRDYDLRYPSGYNLTLPSPQHSIEFVSALRDAVLPRIKSEGVHALLQFHSRYRGYKVRWSD